MSYTPIIIIAICVLFVFSFIRSYNALIRLKNRIEEAFSIIDTELKRRFDLVPNLVEIVKGYAKHEKETLTDVINARNKGLGANTVEEKDNASNELSHAISKLLLLKEAYPDLKANTNFINLQEQITKIEMSLLQSRKYYNAIVGQFNTRIEVFPQNIVAAIFSFKKRPYLKIDEEERQNVKISF